MKFPNEIAKSSPRAQDAKSTLAVAVMLETGEKTNASNASAGFGAAATAVRGSMRPKGRRDPRRPRCAPFLPFPRACAPTRRYEQGSEVRGTLSARSTATRVFFETATEFLSSREELCFAERGLAGDLRKRTASSLKAALTFATKADVKQQLRGREEKKRSAPA